MKKRFKRLQEDTASEKMTTLSAATNHATENGYTLNFKIHDNGMLWDGNETYYDPEEVRIDNFYRFEGESDPGDSAILYLISTEYGNMGMLVDGYGAYDDARLSEFIRKVTSIQKKQHEHSTYSKNRKQQIACYVGAGLLLAGSFLVIRSLTTKSKCK